jgi:type II secretory pathway pseudopilin PulG
MNTRSLAALLLVLLLAPAPCVAAQPRESLTSYVPANAFVVAELPSAQGIVRSLFDADSAQMRAELGAFLQRTVGIDLVAVESAVAWSSQLVPAPTWAVLFRYAKTAPLHGVKVASFEGIDLMRLDEGIVAAVTPAGILVGVEAEVRRGISAARKSAPSLPASSPLYTALSDRSLDFVLAIDPQKSGNPQLSAAADQWGVRLVRLSFRDPSLISLEATGDAQKLQNAQTLLVSLANAGIAAAKSEKEKKVRGNDVVEGATAIASYYQMEKLWKQLTPKLVGNSLVSQYRLPEGKSMMATVGVIGVMAAVAVPAFMKYNRRSKTIEATLNTRRLADAAYNYALSHKGQRFPASTPWTPARACCGSPGDKCVPDAKAWSAPTWKALEFAIDEPHYYQYRVTREGSGNKSKLTVEARGDLDCDGKPSSFKRSVSLDPQGNPVQSQGVETENELE